jgi:hypothetical protein
VAAHSLEQAAAWHACQVQQQRRGLDDGVDELLDEEEDAFAAAGETEIRWLEKKEIGSL